MRLHFRYVEDIWSNLQIFSALNYWKHEGRVTIFAFLYTHTPDIEKHIQPFNTLTWTMLPVQFHEPCCIECRTNITFSTAVQYFTFIDIVRMTNMVLRYIFCRPRGIPKTCMAVIICRQQLFPFLSFLLCYPLTSTFCLATKGK